MVEVKGLTKIYKLTGRQKKELNIKDNTKIAVDDVSFTANEGEIFGLLGPNGAGKTTTLRVISTLLKPTKGEVLVEGHDTVREADLARADICFLTNELKLDPKFTPRYLFRMF